MTTHSYLSIEERDREEARDFQRQFLGSMVGGGLACLAIIVVVIIGGIKFGLL